MKKNTTTDEWLMKASTNRNPFQKVIFQMLISMCLFYACSLPIPLAPFATTTLSKSIKIQNYQFVDLRFEKQSHKFVSIRNFVNEKCFEWILAVLRTDKKVLITGVELTAIRTFARFEIDHYFMINSKKTTAVAWVVGSLVVRNTLPKSTKTCQTLCVCVCADA